MKLKNKPALFLDRDGVINHMANYSGSWDSPQKPEDVKLMDGIEKVLKWANKQKITVVEVSNQPGVAKGKMQKETSDAIESRVHELLKEHSIHIDQIYTCPHHPKGVVPELTMDCNCRKPKPGLLLQAAKELKIDLARSVILGDKSFDVEAGKMAGTKTIIFLHHEDELQKVEEAKKATADYKVNSLDQTIPILEKLFLL